MSYITNDNYIDAMSSENLYAYPTLDNGTPAIYADPSPGIGTPAIYADPSPGIGTPAIYADPSLDTTITYIGLSEYSVADVIFNI